MKTGNSWICPVLPQNNGSALRAVAPHGIPAGLFNLGRSGAREEAAATTVDSSASGSGCAASDHLDQVCWYPQQAAPQPELPESRDGLKGPSSTAVLLFLSSPSSGARPRVTRVFLGQGRGSA